MRYRRVALFPIAMLLAAAGGLVPLAAAAQQAAPVAAAAPIVPAAPQAIAEVLRKKTPGKIKPFYAGRNFWPLWAPGGYIGPEAETLLFYLDSAQFDGLNPKSYKVRDLRKVIDESRGGDPRKIASAELKLSRAFAQYVIDLKKKPQGGLSYANPSLAPPKKPREENALRAASMAQPFGSYMTSMGWMSAHYVRMRNLYARAMQQRLPQEAQARIRLNLERARVLPGPWAHHIVVDSSSARLWFYQGGRQAGTMKVVVGKQSTPTPMLAGTLHYAILNPYWNVPPNLVQTNVAVKVLAGRTLRDMNMEALSDWTENARRVDQRAIDWKTVAAGTLEQRVRQLPGPYNSMGRVKFEFPNELGIYLHDTPEREYLTKEDRHFSNGCIRLEDANGLGKWLLGAPVKLGGAPEQVIPLPAPVPVYITYFTVYDGPNGAIQFTPDLYGRDLPPGSRPAPATVSHPVVQPLPQPATTVAVSPSK